MPSTTCLRTHVISQHSGKISVIFPCLCDVIIYMATTDRMYQKALLYALDHVRKSDLKLNPEQEASILFTPLAHRAWQTVLMANVDGQTLSDS